MQRGDDCNALHCRPTAMRYDNGNKSTRCGGCPKAWWACLPAFPPPMPDALLLVLSCLLLVVGSFRLHPVAMIEVQCLSYPSAAFPLPPLSCYQQSEAPSSGLKTDLHYQQRHRTQAPFRSCCVVCVLIPFILHCCSVPNWEAGGGQTWCWKKTRVAPEKISVKGSRVQHACHAEHMWLSTMMWMIA